MRPEISNVVRQIYPNLKDAPNVFGREDIRGINKQNYLFFNHSFSEETIAQIQSKSNPQEADMIIRFTNYLLQQKYNPDQITILSLYTGQLLTIKSKISD